MSKKLSKFPELYFWSELKQTETSVNQQKSTNINFMNL